ncbi:hypothetical protein KBD20_04295 [Candidatus Saccharibacteria bacterium]|nr:hypothetical protein [Candidatus Saccharibacteria bacterium]
MRHHLASYVSGSIARKNPLEGGPRLEAALDGSGVIADTWGGYATRLMDLYDIEPEEAIALLELTPAHMRDSDIHFQSGRGFGDFEYHTKQRYIEAATKDLIPEVLRMQNTVDTVMSGYVLSNTVEAKNQAEDIQLEIDIASEEGRLLEFGSAERDQYNRDQDFRCMKRDALYSGVSIQLDEFVRTMLETNILDPEYPSELWKVWITALDHAVDYFWRDSAKPDLKISEMVAGRSIFIDFKSSLSDTYAVATEISEARWKVIEPIFRADLIHDISLVAGTEQ